MTEDDSQLEPREPGGDTHGLAMERIKELEKQLKLKEAELSEKTIDSKARIA